VAATSVSGGSGLKAGQDEVFQSIHIDLDDCRSLHRVARSEVFQPNGIDSLTKIRFYRIKRFIQSLSDRMPAATGFSIPREENARAGSIQCPKAIWHYLSAKTVQHDIAA
jgi:hypothetical protein